MGFLISAVLAAASTTCCVLIAVFSRGHVQEFAGFLSIVAFASTLALSIGAAEARREKRPPMEWAKLITEGAAFVVLLPVTALVGAVAFVSAFPIFLMLLPVTEWPQPVASRGAA